MFTNYIPTIEKTLQVQYEDYAKRHFLKSFEKKYPGEQWDATNKSILYELARLRMPNNDIQKTQQVDELNHTGCYWLFKYDFRVAKTKESYKTSGNRCIAFLDNDKGIVKILLIYNKNDLPKDKDETAYIYETIKSEYSWIWNDKFGGHLGR